jgi:hypothetical protein
MTGSFLAAWTKLRRPALLWGTYGATAAVTALVTTLVVTFAEPAAEVAAAQEGAGAAPPGPAGLSTTTESLAAASGLLEGLSSAVGVFGIIALCVAAATFAGEYTSGTLRNLLVREPRRLRLLAGTWAAVATFTAGAVLVAAVVAAGLASALAGGQGIDTDLWFTADGLGSSLATVGQVALSAVGYATLGAALGVLMRTPIPAVALGVAWLFLVETIVVGTVDGSDGWLPGQLLSAVAAGGTETVTMAAALVTVGAYLVLSAGAAATSFVRRDVTA